MLVIGPRVTFAYLQATGAFYVEDSDFGRALLGRGYSGSGVARNNPLLEHEIAKGPIPRGVWRIGRAYEHKRLGPCCLPLSPVKLELGRLETERSGFFIHGDNVRGNGSASTGCIILPRQTRECIRSIGAQHLIVE